MEDPIYSSLRRTNANELVSPESLVHQSKILTKEEAENVVNEKIAFKPVLLVPTMSDGKARKQTISRQSKKQKTLSSKEKRKLQLNTVPKHLKYDQFEPLHFMWCNYLEEAIGNSTGESLLAKMIKAEYHGSYMRVVCCKSPSRNGIEGICIHESKNMLSLVTKNNNVVRIPKIDTIMQVIANMSSRHLVVELYAHHLLLRAGDRSNRRFKGKNTIDL
ncbi:RNase P and RNase MRP subunit [Schizosaccharomyces cryophilus OY26]|uniref:Ribonuclease P protein subunit n=1 Tax=Schizosaccharomyces cryophilus (strain OY26 / ATCC MYA-4695 / CBS 11777 / NBRC 106824 / NRRL Y48691) TaxID=653667 RepID=S9X9B2_SCHCR|nr:RNase P and RNase MRP subunit [Schizosaccharomyces cryophilus OY26]EPY53797.1 RNase P and RNase MRP subunit [Schizosaccharomyces cryophilus OY26]